ncbi:MAG: VCBS repeat-containing protein [Phycisphaerae bacterium]|jgi:hypothetical protein
MMRSNRRFVVIVWPVLPLAAAGAAWAQPAPDWTGAGRCRLLVRVDPLDLAPRTSDQMPARCELDFTALLGELGIDGGADLATLQVHKYDPATGKAEPFPTFDNARSPFDRPCRFDDRGVPSDYPDRANYSSDQPHGRGPVTLRKEGGRLFNREKDNTSGAVVWLHTQESARPSHYAIYWDVCKPGAPSGPSPAPWIGDVDVLRREKGQPLGGLSHFTACVGDFNGDGLFDILAGAEKGDLMWFPNRGRPGAPAFVGCRMLTDDEGPIDCGWYAAPFLTDWDADGLPDLLAGTSHDAILWWKNVGTKTAPRLSYRGFVQADGKRLEVPESPVPEDTAAIFARDYYNQPWVGDLDADGLPDLITGGYTTGLIFHYRCTGRDEQGVPRLTYVGPLSADGQVIDTVWAAAPALADFDADGRIDLVTGAWFWSGIQRPPRPGEDDYLMYFRNVGTASQPRFERREFPKDGSFPSGAIARPSVVDWNGDGLLDLLVSDSSGSVYRFLNVGSAGEPRWRMNRDELTIPWGFVREFAFSGSYQPKGAERPILVSGESFWTFAGSAATPRVERLGSAKVNGQRIDHPGPGYGDPYHFTALCDWDRDGRMDLLWGTHQGNVYLHRGQGGDKPFDFAEGIRLKLTTGEDLRVGPEVVDSPAKARDFTILQGSRIIMVTADFDGDGIEDLAVTETFGNIWVFRNTRAGGTDSLAPGVLVGKVPLGRSDDLNVVDWNDDGMPDLIVGQPVNLPGNVYINRCTAGRLSFDKPIRPLDLPFLFWGANFHALDWNKDGDGDFIIQSEFYTFWAERSYLKHGHAKAVAVGPPESRGKGP